MFIECIECIDNTCTKALTTILSINLLFWWLRENSSYKLVFDLCYFTKKVEHRWSKVTIFRWLSVLIMRYTSLFLQ